MFDLYSLLWSPFQDFMFMRKALVACILISLSAAPVGVFMVIRRMSLTGDAMAHAILPGVALAYLFYGFSLITMTAGGILAGLLVAFLSAYISRSSQLQEESSLAALYLVFLAVGVLLLSVNGNNVDLLGVLFGSVLAIDQHGLLLLAMIASVSLLIMGLIYRSLLLECFDPQFFQLISRSGMLAHYIFLLLLVINLVAGFHALGTLMSVGLMIIPAVASRFWVSSVPAMMFVAAAMAVFASYLGLLLSFYFDLPSGPAIIILLGMIYMFSLIIGPKHGLLRLRLSSSHLAH